MAAETLPYQNSIVSNSNSSSADAVSVKKPRENDRRRRRRKPKKNNKKSSEQPTRNTAEDSDDAKENTDPKQVVENVEIEYVPEKADLDEDMDEEFRKIFEKFSFSDVIASEETDKKDESAENAATNKKADSDSDDENENELKEKGVSNKKKKLQRRMKIAQLKQVSSRPDVVEVWDATAADPKLLVFLKSYRNTVPVPRHWCQKRKFLQGSGCGNHQAWTCGCLEMGILELFLFYYPCYVEWEY